MKPQDILDTAAVAKAAGVKQTTVNVWRNRGILPEPAGYVSGSPYWLRYVITAWAAETGRTGKKAKPKATPYTVYVITRDRVVMERGTYPNLGAAQTEAQTLLYGYGSPYTCTRVYKGDEIVGEWVQW